MKFKVNIPFQFYFLCFPYVLFQARLHRVPSYELPFLIFQHTVPSFFSYPSLRDVFIYEEFWNQFHLWHSFSFVSPPIMTLFFLQQLSLPLPLSPYHFFSPFSLVPSSLHQTYTLLNLSIGRSQGACHFHSNKLRRLPSAAFAADHPIATRPFLSRKHCAVPRSALHLSISPSLGTHLQPKQFAWQWEWKRGIPCRGVQRHPQESSRTRKVVWFVVSQLL